MPTRVKSIRLLGLVGFLLSSHSALSLFWQSNRPRWSVTESQSPQSVPRLELFIMSLRWGVIPRGYCKRRRPGPSKPSRSAGRQILPSTRGCRRTLDYAVALYLESFSSIGPPFSTSGAERAWQMAKRRNSEATETSKGLILDTPVPTRESRERIGSTTER